jgi:hypothetical protein
MARRKQSYLKGSFNHRRTEGAYMCRIYQLWPEVVPFCRDRFSTLRTLAKRPNAGTPRWRNRRGGVQRWG